MTLTNIDINNSKKKTKKGKDIESALPEPCSHSSGHEKSSLLKWIKTAFKIMLILSAVIVLGGCVWFTMGPLFLAQLSLLAIVVYLFVGGGFKLLYLMYKTIWRDASALHKYLLFLWSVRSYSKTDSSVADIFRQMVKNDPNKVLFIFEDKEWTTTDVEEYSNRVANVFKNAGIKKGDAVALMMNNRPEFVCIWLGISKLGAITALINYNLRETSLAHCINIAKCSAFIFDLEFINAVREIKQHFDGSLKMFCWSEESSEFDSTDSWVSPLTNYILEVDSESPKNIEKPGFHDKLVYIYTSGTTGLPKAAVVTHARYLFLAGAIRYQLGFRSTDRFYTSLPLYHTAGGAMGIGQAILYGSCVVIRKKFSATAYFSDIVKYNCTVSQYIGEMCRYVLSTPVKPDETKHKLRIIYGNGLRPQIWKPFVERFKIPRVGEFYGATEGNANIVNTDNTIGAIGFISMIFPSVYPISIIKVNPGTGEPIRNSKGLCIRCRPGEPGVFIGKIIPSNPARQFLGYVNEKDSDKKIVFDVFEKGDSAFLSGDIIECDDLGYLYFKDRTGDTFRWKGENVSTPEVEAIVSNCAQYRDCVVYGVQIPGTEGRAGMAAILDKDDALNLVSLAEGLQKYLPSYARPLFIRCLSHVEMTGTFKMKKVDLQSEGFDPEKIKDKLFYLTKNGSYELLTTDVYKDIISEKVRF